MTNETTPTLRDFGEVMEELMRSRGLEPDPANVRALAARSGLDGDALLRSMIAGEAEGNDLLGGLRGLDEELALSEEEKRDVGVAYAYGAVRRGDAS